MKKGNPTARLAMLLALALTLCLLCGAASASEAGAVANVNGTEYISLKEAFAQAPSGATVVLVNSISGFTTSDIAIVPEGKTLTLDMNGKSITVDGSFTGRPIVNNGTLVVTGNGIIDSSASEFGGYGAINNFGMLTIENGTYRGSIMADGSAVYVRPGGEAVINGGTFEGCAAVNNAGTLTVNGGVFQTTSCNRTTDSNGKTGHWAYCLISSDTLYFNNGSVTGVQGALAINRGYAEVKGGTFQTVGCKHSSTGAYSFYALYIAGEVGQVEAHISGGSYTSASRVAVLCGNDNTGGDGGINAKATAHISGGTFIGGGDGTALQAGVNTGDPTITGGTFSDKVRPDGTHDAAYVLPYVAPGLGQIDNQNGTFTIKGTTVSFLNEDGSTAYKTIDVVPNNKIDAALAPTPTKAGCSFVGWRIDGSQALWNFDTDVVANTAVKLLAVWAVKQPASVTLTADREAAHAGQSITLSASVTHEAAGAAYAYSWYRNGAPLNAPSAPSLTVSEPGAYTVKVEVLLDGQTSAALESNAVTCAITAHAFGSEWASDAAHHWHACAGCDEKKDLAPHTSDAGAVTRPATETAAGERVFRCTVCGAALKTEAIPALPSSAANVPKTGDSSAAPLWLALMLLAGGGLAAALYSKKKAWGK